MPSGRASHATLLVTSGLSGSSWALRPMLKDLRCGTPALWGAGRSPLSLIPSAAVTLGYDRSRPRAMSDDEIAAWGQTILCEDFRLRAGPNPPRQSIEEEIAALMREHKIPTLAEYLDDCTSSLRRVTFEAFLIETQAADITAHPLPGHHRAHTLRPVSHRAVCEQLAGSAFRLPTSDEWETPAVLVRAPFFAGAMPAPSIDTRPDRAIRFRTGWHLGPNAFGLHIAQDPYRWELCAEPNIMRGGDGGSSICGGAGFILGDLPLASAFVQIKDNEDKPIFGVHLRRVHALF